jgi:hypothetical protein
MKIYSLEVTTDLGRRVVQFSPALDVEPHGDVPLQFRSLPELLWGVLCEAAVQTAPKVEA